MSCMAIWNTHMLFAPFLNSLVIDFSLFPKSINCFLGLGCKVSGNDVSKLLKLC